MHVSLIHDDHDRFISIRKTANLYHVECPTCGSQEIASTVRCENCGAILPSPTTRRRKPECTSRSKRKDKGTYYLWPKKSTTRKGPSRKMQPSEPIEATIE